MATAHSPQTPSAAYFTDQKKGEVNELKLVRIMKFVFIYYCILTNIYSYFSSFLKILMWKKMALGNEILSRKLSHI